MKKILNSMFLAFLLLCITTPPLAKAADVPTRIVDAADLVTDEEEKELNAKLDELSAKYNLDIVITTTDLLAGSTPQESADIAYETMGCQEDGMILYIAMVTRDVGIRPQGNCDVNMITADGATFIREKITPDLSDENYMEAFEKYISWSDKFLEQAKTGTPYDGSHMPRELMDYLKALGIAVVIGLIVAFLIVSSMKAKLKTVGLNRAAADYMKCDSMHVTQSNDMFLYRTVNRRPRPKNNSSGGGGRSSGGGGSFGKF